MRAVRLLRRLLLTDLGGKATVVDLLLATCTLVTASVPFLAVYGDATGLLAAVAGVVTGVALAWATATRRLSALPTVAVVGAVHVALGPFVVPGVGSWPGSVRTVLASTVTVWRDTLTLALPLSPYAGTGVLAWLTALVCAVAAGRLLLAGHPHLATVPPLVLLGTAVAWGGHDTAAPSVAGGFTVAGVLALWTRETMRSHRRDVDEVMGRGDSGLARVHRHDYVTAGVVLGVVAVLVAVVAPAAPHARTVLRDAVEPPLDLTQYATPLSLVRVLETDMAATSLLQVSDLPDGARIRIASLDSYDGLTARIGEDSSGSARFQRVGHRSVLAGVDAAVPATEVTLTVEGYTFPWLPTVADTVSLVPAGPRAPVLAETLYHDSFSATAIVTAGTAQGDVFHEDVVPAPVPAESWLSTLALADVPLGTVEEVPSSVSALASTIVGSGSEPLAQVRALQQALRTSYYSDGTESPSQPGHGAARLAAMAEADSLVGDDEQYSVLMMLMCRSLGIPARVVMGFDPAVDGDATDVTGEDVSAWVEVAFAGAGWVPFEVTPDRDQVPQQQTTQKVSNPEPQVLQPPLPVQEPAQLPPDYEDTDETGSDERDGRALPTAVLVAAGVLAALVLPVLTVLAAKTWRRSRRRRAPDGVSRALGAWDEVVDAARDLGQVVPPGATRRETARHLAPHFPRADLPRLGRAVDAQVFGRGVPSAYALRALWDAVGATVPAMAADRSRLKRVLARVSPRSLVHPAGRSVWRHRRLRRSRS